MSEGPDWNAFHHDKFLRGDLQSCRLMARLRKSSTSAATSPHTCDPNFYAMPFMPELTQTFSLREETSTTHQTEPSNNQERESAAVTTLLAVEERADSHDIRTSSGPSSKKRPNSKSYEKMASKKKRTETDECIPPTTTSSVHIQGQTTNGQECDNIHMARNPTLAIVPQWSAAPWNINLPAAPRERRVDVLAAALPLQTLPNVGIPSAARMIVCTPEDITRCYAYMEARSRFTAASLMQTVARIDQPNIHQRITSPLESQYQMTTFDMQPNSFPVAVPSSSVATLPTVEQNQRGIFIPRTSLFQRNAFPRQW